MSQSGEGKHGGSGSGPERGEPTRPMAEDEPDVGSTGVELRAMQEPLEPQFGGSSGNAQVKGGLVTKRCPATQGGKCQYVNGVCKQCQQTES